MSDQADIAVEDRVLAALSPEPEREEQQAKDVDTGQEQQGAQVDTGQAQVEQESPEDTLQIDFDAKLFDVEVMTEGGQKTVEKLSLNDLKSQRMMQADYQRKTQELAKERSQAHEAARQQTSQLQGRYVQTLQTLQAAVQRLAVPELQNIDLNRLAVEDPAQYIQVQHRLQTFNTTLSAVQQEMDRVNQERAEQRQQTLAQSIQKANEELPKLIPGWNNDRYQTLLKAGVEQFGFTAEEVHNVVDPRYFRVLDLAHKQLQLESGKGIVEKKVVNVPKVIKPGTSNPNRASEDRNQDLKARLRKSGGKDIDVLAALVKSTLR